MPLPASTIESLLRATFTDAEIILNDLAGDNDHWEATIISAAFIGKSRVEQHKMVYAALGEVVGRELHAIKVNTKVPA